MITKIWDKICYIYYNFSVRRFWDNLFRWFSYYKVCRNIYDFDHTSILEVEKHQIMRVRDCIKKYNNHVNADRDIERMNTAIKLLDIILEDGCSESYGKLFDSIPLENGNYRLVSLPNSGWIMPIYVNTRNHKRFAQWDESLYKDKRAGDLYRDHLRLQKAWNIYYDFRKNWTFTWWD